MSISSSSSLVDATPQFLFTDEDFESSEFHAASFVAKYRRATSLDSLRSQLRLYCQSLKDQLYNIINRDYKDFITIATKLEGVDHRVEYLRKPLIELRMDLTLLHDTMVSNLHAISAKLRERREVSSRRKLLESSLACMTKLTNVEDVLNLKHNPSSSSSSSSPPPSSLTTARRTPLSRRALLQEAARAQPASHSTPSSSSSSPATTAATSAAAERLELHQCSELERAAMTLAEANQHLREEEHQQLNQLQQLSGSSKGKSSSHPPATVAMRRTLELRAQNMRVALLARLHLCCKVLLTSTSSTSTTTSKTLEGGGGGGGGGGGMSECRRRSLGHLLRGLVAMDSGAVMEDLLAELFVLPALKTVLTQGRVDGKSGRGSYSGLQECLSLIVRTTSEHVTDTLLLAEELFGCYYQQAQQDSAPPPPMDLVVNGIWVPVLNTLKKNYAGMFSSGMASVFHQCYHATHQFINELSGICGAKRKESIAARLQSHASFAEFKGLWKMDLYYQVSVFCPLF
jgi:hypothetical protein